MLLATTGCMKSSEKDLQHAVDLIAVKWVPDHRTAICNAELKKEGNRIILKGETTIPEAKANIINALDSLHIKLIDSLLILPDTIVNPKYQGVVTLSVINLRKEPQHSSELVSQAILGTPVTILKSLNSWLLVQTPDSYIAWTEKSSVSIKSRAEMNRWKKSHKGIYLDNTGWVADTTLEAHGIVGDLVGGSIMEIAGETKDFFRIILPDGRTGYVAKNKIADFDTWKLSFQCTGEGVCKTAMTYMGIPYLWGGTSPKGADCSGFVQSVFFRNGLILQRDASLQALHGTPVDISDSYDRLVKGDLLFFGSENGGKPHVTHVAIYIGNKDYINAAGRVMINSLDSARENFSDYRLSALLFARHVIGTEENAGNVPINKHLMY